MAYYYYHFSLIYKDEGFKKIKKSAYVVYEWSLIPIAKPERRARFLDKQKTTYSHNNKKTKGNLWWLLTRECKILKNPSFLLVKQMWFAQNDFQWFFFSFLLFFSLSMCLVENILLGFFGQFKLLEFKKKLIQLIIVYLDKEMFGYFFQSTEILQQ